MFIKDFKLQNERYPPVSPPESSLPVLVVVLTRPLPPEPPLGTTPHLFNAPRPVSVPGLDLSDPSPLVLKTPGIITLILSVGFWIHFLFLWSFSTCFGTISPLFCPTSCFGTRSQPLSSLISCSQDTRRCFSDSWLDVLDRVLTFLKHFLLTDTSGISYLWSWFQVIYVSDPSLIVVVPSPTLSEHLPHLLSSYQVLSLWSISFCLATSFSPLEPLTTCPEHVWSYFCDQLRPTVVPLIAHLIRYPGPELLDLLLTVLVPGLLSVIPILLSGLLTSLQRNKTKYLLFWKCSVLLLWSVTSTVLIFLMYYTRPWFQALTSCISYPVLVPSLASSSLLCVLVSGLDPSELLLWFYS